MRDKKIFPDGQIKILKIAGTDQKIRVHIVNRLMLIYKDDWQVKEK